MNTNTTSPDNEITNQNILLFRNPGQPHHLALKRTAQMNKINTHVCPATEWQWKAGMMHYFKLLKEYEQEENSIKRELLNEALKQCAAWNRHLDELTRKHYMKYPPQPKSHDQNLHSKPLTHCIPCQPEWLRQVSA